MRLSTETNCCVVSKLTETLSVNCTYDLRTRQRKLIGVLAICYLCRDTTDDEKHEELVQYLTSLDADASFHAFIMCYR